MQQNAITVTYNLMSDLSEVLVMHNCPRIVVDLLARFGMCKSYSTAKDRVDVFAKKLDEDAKVAGTDPIGPVVEIVDNHNVKWHKVLVQV